MQKPNLSAHPDRVFCETEQFNNEMVFDGHIAQGAWVNRDLRVAVNEISQNRFSIELSAGQNRVKRIHMRWRGEMRGNWRVLGDAWERGYGDLEWRGLVAERTLPWYAVLTNGKEIYSFGVETGGAALAYWQVDGGGIQLVLDVRNGGQGVLPGERTLTLCQVVVRAGEAGETPYEVTRALCAQLCSHPRLPAQPVYGANDWYYRYGQSTHQTIVEDAKITDGLAKNEANRPFVVIDGGWQAGLTVDGDIDGGDRSKGNARFPDMPGLAATLKQMGVRPGIWVRPLTAPAGIGVERLISSPAGSVYAGIPILDPSLDENLDLVAQDFRRLREWGFELIKHDFSTVDILGRWGFAMGNEVTGDGWGFKDSTRTSAEIIRKLYETIREASGDALILGCNTIGHLGAGLFDLQRTGDDTSGREWERTRKMGVNTLAFRMPQHGTFFCADADCVGLTEQIPWKLNQQWLNLLARSGTALFVSAQPEALGIEQKRALSESFSLAAVEQPAAVALDWMDTTCPVHWNCGGEEITFDWFE